MLNPKILYGINQLSIGGTERQLYELVTNIRKYNYQPHVFCLSSGGEFAKLLIQQEIPLLVAKRRYRTDPKPILTLIKYLEENNFNLIHLFDFYAGLYGRLAATVRKDLNIVYSIRSTRIDTLRSMSNPFYFFIDRILSKYTNAITVNAKAVKSFAINDIKLPSDKILVIHNGINDEWFSKDDFSSKLLNNTLQRHNIPINSILIGNIARINPVKDHITFINAANIIKNIVPNIYFLIVGDGSYRGYLEEYSRGLGLSKHVIFTGSIPSAEVIQIYDALNVYVSSSISEGFSNSILEAMARGKPIVATNLSGTSELIEDKVNGILIDPQNPRALADQIINLILNKDLALKLGQEAYRTAKHNYSIGQMLQKHNTLYKSLISEYDFPN